MGKGSMGGMGGMGGKGGISVTANVAPRLCATLHNSWQNRDIDTFSEVRDQLMPLHDALFCETSPGPVKYAASLLGKCDDYCRPPIVPIAESSKTAVRDAMVSVGLLN